MSKVIILSKNKLMSAERIFKKSLVYDGVKRWSSKNHNDRCYLKRLLNLDKINKYDHVIMVENFCPTYINMLILGESDFYVFDATQNNLNILRKTNKDLDYGISIVYLLQNLSKKNISKILSKSDFTYSLLGQLLPFTINIDAVFRSFSNFVIADYNSFFLKKVISTRDNFLTYYP